jgi:hypothetical protein
MIDSRECPSCGRPAETLPAGDFARCLYCGLRGCEKCLPGGDGTACLDCTGADGRDTDPTERPA